MLSKKISLSIPRNNSSYGSSLNIQDKPDFFINIGEKIFPINRKQFAESVYISQISMNQTFHVIAEPLNNQMVQKIFSIMGGKMIIINKFKELKQALDIINYFSINYLENSIQKQIQACFQDYEIFPLLSLSYQFNLHQIFSMCITQLEYQQFEQINYNKFEFIHFDFKLFQIVLRRHHKLKITGKINGLNSNTIQQVIKLYCSTHHYSIQTENRLNQKYVKGLINYDSLKLDRIYTKQVQKSVLCEHDEVAKQKQLKETGSTYENHYQTYPKKIRNRKYSCNVNMGNQTNDWVLLESFGNLVPKKCKSRRDSMVVIEQNEIDGQIYNLNGNLVDPENISDNMLGSEKMKDSFSFSYKPYTSGEMDADPDINAICRISKILDEQYNEVLCDSPTKRKQTLADSNSDDKQQIFYGNGSINYFRLTATVQIPNI